jgi:hypothetical protein
MSDAPELVKINDHEYRCSGCPEFGIFIPQDLRPDETWIRARFAGHVERHHFTGELPPDPPGRRKLAKGTRAYVLRNYVMSAIANDYESFQIVTDTVAEWAKKDGVKVFHRQELLAEIGALVRDGYALAYILSPQPPHTSIAEYRESRADELWFWLTVAGIRALKQLE